MQQRPPRVFISYSHDSEEHKARVLELASRLRADGIDAELDQYLVFPPQGWYGWMFDEVDKADSVLIVCTKGYYEKIEDEDFFRQWTNGRWEGAILDPAAYVDDAESGRVDFVPVVFSPENAAFIPTDMKATHSWFDLSEASDYEALYRRLTQQPEVLRPSLGKVRRLPLRQREPAAAKVPWRDSLLGGIAWRKRLFQRLRQDGAKVSDGRPFSVAPDVSNRWLLRVRLPEDLREYHGLAPELLVLAVPDEVRAKDLSRAREELFRTDLDIDPDLLLIVDSSRDLERRLPYIVPSRGGQWIPWLPVDGEFPSLAEQLRAHLPAHDIFEFNSPVRGRQVIGRQRTVADLSKQVRQGQAVGVFGLRKVGKTTVVRAVTDHIDPVSMHLYSSPVALSELAPESTDRLVTWLDCQVIHERSVEAVARKLGRELERRLQLEGFRVEGDEAFDSYLQRLDRLLDEIFRRSSWSLCLVLDEYDLLFEGETGETSVQGIERLFGLLRGYAQETGRLALVVIGRDPTFLDRPKMGGVPNPMLQWFTPYWLGPLSQADATDLLDILGRRVLLDVGGATQRRAYKWTGGHPLLHRQFGSALLGIARACRFEGAKVATDPLLDQALSDFLDLNAVTVICREVSDLLASKYPQAATYFSTLCCAAASEVAGLVRQQAAGRRDDLLVLRHFGLLLETKEGPWIPEVFRWFTQAIEAHDQRISA